MPLIKQNSSPPSQVKVSISVEWLPEYGESHSPIIFNLSCFGLHDNGDRDRFSTTDPSRREQNGKHAMMTEKQSKGPSNGSHGKRPFS